MHLSLTIQNELLVKIGQVADGLQLQAYAVGGYVRDRLLLPMVLEATRLIEERKVDDPRDIDLGLIFGVAVSGMAKRGDDLVLIRVLEQIFDACMRIVHFAMLLAPLAVFAIVFNTAFTFGTASITSRSAAKSRISPMSSEPMKPPPNSASSSRPSLE